MGIDECVCVCKNWFPWETVRPNYSRATLSIEYWQFLKGNKTQKYRQRPTTNHSDHYCRVYLCAAFVQSSLFLFRFIFNFVVFDGDFLLLSLFIGFWHLCCKRFNVKKSDGDAITSSSSRPCTYIYILTFNWLDFYCFFLLLSNKHAFTSFVRSLNDSRKYHFNYITIPLQKINKSIRLISSQNNCSFKIYVLHLVEHLGVWVEFSCHST